MRITFKAFDKLEKLSDLKQSKYQRNKHPDEQIQRLALIMKTHGVRHPISVSTRSGEICFGHGRKAAALLNGYTDYPIIYQDFESDEEEMVCVQSDNAIAMWAELDLAAITEDILKLPPDFNIDLLGIKDFQPVIEKLDPACDEDEVPPDPIEVFVKPGDLFILGEHRLLCGDSTNIQHVERLMNNEKADMVFTDPPYGINVVGKDGNIGGGTEKAKTTKFKQIVGDDAEFDANVCFGYSDKIVLFGGNYFAHSLPKSGRWMVWQKKLFDSDRTLSDCELIWTNLDGVMVKSYQHVWDGYFRAGTKKDELNTRIHPTQKPVALIEKMLNDLEQDKVLDLFGGSGSTLIACEKTNRKCFMMEIDPYYNQVIIERFIKYANKPVYRLNDDGTKTAWTDIKTVEIKANG